jgi:thimet oligopeptidase
MLARAVEETLQAKRSALDAVIAVAPSERTFLNTIAPLEYASDALSDLQQQIDLLLGVHPDEAMRAAAEQAAHRIDEANIEMEYDRRLWQAVQQWMERHEVLDAIDQKLVDDIVRDMRRMGFALSEKDFSTLKSNTTELQRLQTQFEKAINDWDDGILVTREQLRGLPERYVNGLSRVGDQYRVTLEYPDLFPFMRQADDDDARRELATKNLLRGGRENLERLARMIELRQDNARLLGFASHADFVAEPRMVRTAATATHFVERIIGRLIPAARRELVELIDIKKDERNLPQRKPLAFHEMAYWGHKLLKQRFALDEERVKEYFPVQRVIEGMLALYQEVLGVQFQRCEGISLWHPDAQLYEVRDGARTIGHFALDLYPRKGKYGHAAAFPIILGRQTPGGASVLGFVALVCNFPKPTPQTPSLLAHDEVETILHEFGHVMHALLSGGRWQRQNGFGVALDFVEALSQLFEEWAWDATILERLSGHYQTGEPMPEPMKQSLIASRHHMDANAYLQQAVKALYDLRIHSQPQGIPVSAQMLADQYRAIKLEAEAVELPEVSLFPAGWGHMSDYDAGYYGYLWSKVYALDMYTPFASNPLSTEIGRRYRVEVLEPGAQRAELELVRAFLRREPSDAPFLSALGIQES